MKTNKSPTNRELDNEKRLIANQICYELYRSGNVEQLDLLRMYCESAIKRIKAPTPATD